MTAPDRVTTFAITVSPLPLSAYSRRAPLYGRSGAEVVRRALRLDADANFASMGLSFRRAHAAFAFSRSNRRRGLLPSPMRIAPSLLAYW